MFAIRDRIDQTVNGLLSLRVITLTGLFIPHRISTQCTTHALSMHVIHFILVFAVFFQSASALEEEYETVFERISEDGVVRLIMESSLPQAGSPLTINLAFIDSLSGERIQDMNYDIVAMQNGEIVLSMLGVYASSGIASHNTMPLSTDDQVNVIVILQGIGPDAPYAGPQGEQIEIIVVPEFGEVAFAMLLTSTGVMLIIQRAKAKTLFKKKG